MILANKICLANVSRFNVLMVSALLLCIVISGCFAQSPKRRPKRYLIPEGYVGWVVIKYGIRDAKYLPMEDGKYLVESLTSGLVDTATELDYGWANDEYFYYSSNGKRRQLKATGWGGGGMIWAHSNGEKITKSDKVIFERLFIGTEDEYRKQGATTRAFPDDIN